MLSTHIKLALPAEPSSALGTLCARLIVAVLTFSLNPSVARSRDAGAILIIGREEDLVGLEVTLLGLAESADARRWTHETHQSVCCFASMNKVGLALSTAVVCGVCGAHCSRPATRMGPDPAP